MCAARHNARRYAALPCCVRGSTGWLYRHPFEGASARRYARDERPAFGDLDDRLLDALAAELAGHDRLLDARLRAGHVRARAAAPLPAS